MNTVIIDDHGLFCAGIGHVLKAINPMTQLSEYEAVDEALQGESDRRAADLVLLDLHLPHSHYTDNISRCREHFELAKIVIVSGETSGEKIKTSIELGASGFIPKSANTERLATALDLVVAGGVYLPPELIDYLIADEPAKDSGAEIIDQLTARQKETLRLAINGVSNAIICEELGLKLPTVKQHLRSAYRLLGVHSRTQAVTRCAELGGLA